ncbi:hypothetical protein G0U57_018529, partial [Chelydra serpentina]
QVLASLQWWTVPANVLQGIPFRDPPPSLDLVSDASDVCWGAHVGNSQTQGLWSATELPLHINVKELRAVRLACVVFSSQLSGKTIRVLIDNTAAMFYINRQGGARSSALCQ